MNRSTRILLSLLLIAVFPAACRSPKKVLTELDKQQVKDSVLSEVPTGPEIVPVGTVFDDKVELAAYSLSKTQVKPGDGVALTLYWKSLAKVDGDFKIFVHLDSTKARKTFDHYAVGGLYPTANWNPGEVVKDEIAIQLDANFPVGPAKAWVGFFDARAWKEEKKNVRLAVKTAGRARTDKQDRLLVAAFLVGDVEQKKLVVRKTAAAVSVDGKLDEAGWKQGMVDVGPFYTTDGKLIPEAEKVEAGMMWDDTNLYLAYQVADSDLRTPYTARDSTLWSGGKSGSSDVMEFFFDPDADGLDYLEFQVSPAGVIFDARFTSYREPAWKVASQFNMDVQVKALADGSLNDPSPDKGYAVEVAIPWKSLPGMTGPPGPDRKFSANFFRLSNNGTWAAVWSPVGNDFHDLALAGTVTFGQ
ncbi:MAG: hypothetical protein FJ109_03020 [Deltaproteobacteria bacterium]|nr:hypothetical protein [Deltaproteobacteria bacterium]